MDSQVVLWSALRMRYLYSMVVFSFISTVVLHKGNLSGVVFSVKAFESFQSPT